MVFMPHWPVSLGSKPINYGLERITELMEKLGNPQDSLPPVIHVAGTNGKGSTIAFLRSIFEAAGYKVDIYTSPHLLNFNERISLSGRNISDDYLFQIMDECRIASEGIKTTFFEGTTAGAFLAFARNKADILLLETGMGGRLDATNLVKKPAATVITPISLDHTEYLGPTISLIAGEKAGIMKTGVPCVCSMQTDDADRVIQNKAAELDCQLSSFGYDWMVEKTEDGFIFKSVGNEDIILPKPSLFGDHQIVNAGTAIATIKQLEGFKISDEHIRQGIKTAVWPARMQRISKGPLIKMVPKDWEIWVDGAHNAAGAQALSSSIEGWKDKKLYIISGITKGRDPASLFKYFTDKADFLCGVLIQTEPSALPAERISQAANDVGIDSKACESIEDAVWYLSKVSDAPARILFCGSLYLASDVMKI